MQTNTKTADAPPGSLHPVVGRTWSFLWCRIEESNISEAWKSRQYKGSFDECCRKMADFCASRYGEITVDYEARRDDQDHEYDPKNHEATFPDLRDFEDGPLRQYV